MDEYNRYKSSLLTNTIISHRDLDPKNVLWDKNPTEYRVALKESIFTLTAIERLHSQNDKILLEWQ